MYGAADDNSDTKMCKCVTPMWKYVMCWVQILMIAYLVFVVSWMAFDGKEQFQNLHDYGIKQRGDVVVSIPETREVSTRQQMDERIAAGTSQLTGTRDFPVFFQDYSVEAGRRNGAGAISSAREGFEGGKSDSDLTRALSGQ